MRKQTISIFLFCLFAFPMFSQTGKAIYQKQLASLNNKDSNASNNGSKYKNKVLEHLKTLEYELTFNDSKAVYKKIKSLSTNTNAVVDAMTAGFAQYEGIFYFDRSSKTVLHEQEFAGTTYIIQKNKINWALTKDTLKIDKYICYKATTTRTIVNSEGTHHLEVIAWYVPKISLSYGPDGYGGLPGLILQLENNGVITTLKRIEFLKKKSIKILEPSHGEKITEQEFENSVSKIYEKRKKTN